MVTVTNHIRNMKTFTHIIATLFCTAAITSVTFGIVMFIKQIVLPLF